MVKYLAIFFALFAFSANAKSPPSYRVAPSDSSVEFTATQNSAPVTGKFGTVSGVITFDPDNLKDSKALITIDLNSITASYPEVPKTLKEPEWFNVDKFYTADFTSNSFTSNDGRNFQANGSLTIKGIRLPATLYFTVLEYGPNKAIAEGEATLSRTKFGIGWADTSAVSDEVKVKFRVTATK